MYTSSNQLLTAGVPVKDAQRALIMLHGRGASAHDILGLSRHMALENTAVLAPQASQNSWYPYSFMAPRQQNQPALDSALLQLQQLTGDIENEGIAPSQIFFLGFSQGACLALEYTARNAQAYGGIIAFTGGLIGEELVKDNYQGNFKQTPVLLTTGSPDPHVPLARVKESAAILQDLHALVTLKVYEGRPHTITHEEIKLANQLILTAKTT